MESSLDAGQTFRNDYEESKFMAESLVRAVDFADHVTVYRPAVIAGDSGTGYTNTYHGIYLYLRLMALMIPTLPVGPDGKRHTPIRMRMTGDERRNIIPVEWVSAVMCRLFETPEARGLTFHIAPEHPITTSEIIEYCGDCFNATGATFCGHGEIEPPSTNREENEDQWMFERMYWENAETYAPYERSDNVFDLTNLQRFTGDIVCPDFDRTVMSRYIEYGNEDRWGKRKPETEPISFWAEDQLSALTSNTPNTGEQKIGLDVSGPGGCQLTAVASRAGIHSVVRGLPDDTCPVLHVSNAEIAEMVQSGTVKSLADADWDLQEGMSSEALSDMLLGALQPDSVGLRA